MDDFQELFFESNDKPLEVVETWCTTDNKNFFFSTKSIESLQSGLYSLCFSQSSGFGVQKMEYNKEEFYYLPSSPHEEILEGIKKFWTNIPNYRKYKLSPKRGIILHGKPGCGKTSCIYLLVEEIMKQDGIAIYFNSPEHWIEVAKKLRKIEKGRPVLCIIEDIDLVIEKFGEEVFLNFLDGLNSVENVVYVATTNDIKKISDRIKNRPSRFDRQYEIKEPNQEDIEFYFNHVLLDEDKELYPIPKLVKDCKGFSMAHLREAFISLYIMKNDYTSTLTNLKKHKINDLPKVGFMGLDDEE